MMRRTPPLAVKLAAALLQMKRPDADGVLQPVIPYEHAKLMTAAQIISLFRFDHYPIRHENDGPDEPWNITPRPIIEDRLKTARVDLPASHKSRRINAAEAAHASAMHIADEDLSQDIEEPARRRIPARINPWPAKGARKLGSRSFAQPEAN